ncbi:NADPH:quinone oxidoreductase family protein [Oceanibacterium hippocampi]|uniref:Quinone oxidoreductase 1 n=1 Tax=Oceanibacterium hippocampi TaxID=745714 RepID=A0A1Y5R9K0_9PROT|nr:NADPH:quinone oxidoreductase family protein [Oceanibacterium hippocampi]SLN12307.1 Quinone oxidoreductase 1 [Oceanibacterium hippocampi]
MKALLCKEFGDPDILVMDEIEAPKVGKGQVRIRIHAVGCNFPDTLMIAGTYQFKPSFPFAPGMESSGVVAEVGDGVSGLKVGDRVMASHGVGGFAEEVVAPATNVYKIPDSMPFDQAAAFPVTYGTTYHALVDRANLQPGEVLLVHGAAGGVGLNAVELGRNLGARVIGTVGSDAKADIVREYGAEHVINYSKESIKDRVKELTDGKGADVIYDPVGGDAFDQSMRCINWNGRLLVIGFASGRIPELRTNLVLLKGCQVVGVFWGAFASRDPAANRANFEAMLKWYEDGKIKPHVSMHFPLEKGADALKSLLNRKATGKVVVTVRD